MKDIDAMAQLDSTVRTAGATVALLCVMYSFSIIDRTMPTLLVGDLRADLGLSNLQFGLLAGTSFGLVYAIAGLPLAHLTDRGNRKKILSLALVLWSFCTIASGMAQSYSQLLAARIGLAAGEAALIPAAMSLIADLYTAERRNVMITIFIGSGVAMSGGSFLVCGGALLLAQELSPLLAIPAWRLSFVFVGLPPLLIALLWMVFTSEPVRRGKAVTIEADLRAFGRYLADNLGLYGPLLLMLALVNGIGMAFLIWSPTVFVQEQGLSAAQAATAMVVMTMPAGLLAWPLAPYLAIAAERRRVPGGAITVMLLLLLTGVVGVLILSAATTLSVAMMAFSASCLTFTGIIILNQLIVQWVAPQQFRGRLTAVAQLANALGFAGAPPLVAIIETNSFSGAGHLSDALAILVVSAAVLASAALLLLSSPSRSARHAQGAGAVDA